MVAIANLTIYQGDDYAALVTVLDSTGQPADLTGYAANAQIRLGPADNYPPLYEIVTFIQAPNLVSLSIPHSTTATMRGDKPLQWDLELVSPGGVVTTILAGNVQVTRQITTFAERRAAAIPTPAIPTGSQEVAR